MDDKVCKVIKHKKAGCLKRKEISKSKGGQRCQGSSQMERVIWPIHTRR